MEALAAARRDDVDGGDDGVGGVGVGGAWGARRARRRRTGVLGELVWVWALDRCPISSTQRRADPAPQDARSGICAIPPFPPPPYPAILDLATALVYCNYAGYD